MNQTPTDVLNKSIAAYEDLALVLIDRDTEIGKRIPDQLKLLYAAMEQHERGEFVEIGNLLTSYQAALAMLGMSTKLNALAAQALAVTIRGLEQQTRDAIAANTTKT